MNVDRLTCLHVYMMKFYTSYHVLIEFEVRIQSANLTPVTTQWQDDVFICKYVCMCIWCILPWTFRKTYITFILRPSGPYSYVVASQSPTPPQTRKPPLHTLSVWRSVICHSIIYKWLPLATFRSSSRYFSYSPLCFTIEHIFRLTRSSPSYISS